MRGYELGTWRNPAAVKRTLKGTGMVTAAEDVTVTYQSGRSEVLKAGISRVAPDHPLVKQRPSLFVPCDQADKPTVARMLEYAHSRKRLLEATRGQRARARAPSRRKYGRHQIRRNRLR